jgi:hypothetical protein
LKDIVKVFCGIYQSRDSQFCIFTVYQNRILSETLTWGFSDVDSAKNPKTKGASDYIT